MGGWSVECMREVGVWRASRVLECGVHAGGWGIQGIGVWSACGVLRMQRIGMPSACGVVRMQKIGVPSACGATVLCLTLVQKVVCSNHVRAIRCVVLTKAVCN